MSEISAICKKVALTVLAMIGGFAGALATMFAAGICVWLAPLAAFAMGMMLAGISERLPIWVLAVGYCLPFVVVALISPVDGGTYSSGLLLLLAVCCVPLFAGLGLGRPLLWGRLHPAWTGPAREPCCPQCGYILYHAEEQRCPECGRRFSLHEVDMRLARLDGEILMPRETGQSDSSHQVQANDTTSTEGNSPSEATDCGTARPG